MFTLEIIINAFLSALLVYIAVNSIFRYQFSSERILTSAVLIFIIILFVFRNGENVTGLLISLISLVVVTIFVMVLYNQKKDFGYFLLNIRKNEFEEINTALKKEATILRIKKENIEFENRFPHIVYINNELGSKVRELFKKLDKVVIKKKKHFTMQNYWYIVVLLVLLAVIWRF
ncbi:MAG: hypothetical protein KAU02_04245 [Tenericutes bacterium]|nr:hypothetical protein [Mycoplasmatota bacterium]